MCNILPYLTNNKSVPAPPSSPAGATPTLALAISGISVNNWLSSVLLLPVPLDFFVVPNPLTAALTNVLLGPHKLYWDWVSDGTIAGIYKNFHLN
jgi:hypothetical protein